MYSVLAIASCAYSIFGVVMFLGNACLKCCGGGAANDDAADFLMNAEDGADGVDGLRERERADFVRQQRLKALDKEHALEESQNLEAQLAAKLGMEFGGDTAENEHGDGSHLETPLDDLIPDEVPEFESERDDHEDSENAED